MNEDERQDKADRAEEAVDLNKEILSLKKTLTRYRWSLLYVCFMVTVAVAFQVGTYL